MSIRQSFRKVRASSGCSAFDISVSYGAKRRVWTAAALMPVTLLLSLMSSSASAQSDEALSLKVGESRIIPSVRFEYIQTSNAFLTNTNPGTASSEATEATAFVIKPRAEWEADRRLLTLTGIYDGEYASYSEEILSYTNHSLRGIADAALSTRSRLIYAWSGSQSK